MKKIISSAIIASLLLANLQQVQARDELEAEAQEIIRLASSRVDTGEIKKLFSTLQLFGLEPETLEKLAELTSVLNLQLEYTRVLRALIVFNIDMISSENTKIWKTPLVRRQFKMEVNGYVSARNDLDSMISNFLDKWSSQDFDVKLVVLEGLVIQSPEYKTTILDLASPGWGPYIISELREKKEELSKLITRIIHEASSMEDEKFRKVANIATYMKNRAL